MKTDINLVAYDLYLRHIILEAFPQDFHGARCRRPYILLMYIHGLYSLAELSCPQNRAERAQDALPSQECRSVYSRIACFRAFGR